MMLWSAGSGASDRGALAVISGDTDSMNGIQQSIGAAKIDHSFINDW